MVRTPRDKSTQGGERKRGFWLAAGVAVAQVIILGCALAFWSWRADSEFYWGFLLVKPPLQGVSCFVVVAPILFFSWKLKRSSVPMRDAFAVTQVVFWGLALLTVPLGFFMSLTDALAVVGH